MVQYLQSGKQLADPYLTNKDITGISEDPYKPFKAQEFAPIKDEGTTAGLTLPSISVDLSTGNSSQDNATQDQTQSTTQPTTDQSGGGLNLNLPSVQLPDIPKVDVNLPTVNVDPIVTATKDAGTTLIDTVNRMSDPIIRNVDQVVDTTVQTAADIVQPVVDTASTALTTTADAVGNVVAPVASSIEQTVAPVTNAVGGVVKDVVDEAGNVAQDTIDYLHKTVGDISVPLPGLNIDLAPQLKGVSDYLGIDVPALSSDASVVKSDGSSYGHVAIGNSGYSVDISKSVDSVYNNVTEGTALAGTSGKDVYSAVTNPSDFVNNKTTEAATNLLSNNLGMDTGMAGNVVAAIKYPEKFVETQGKQAATDLISKQTGLDSGLVGAGLDALSSGDIGKAASKAAEVVVKQAASNTVVHAVSGAANAIIPGAGMVVEAIAAIFHYSCYLSTGSFATGKLTRSQYLEFTKYRIKYQANEPFAQQVWIGYQIAFEPVMKKMIADQKFADSIHEKLVEPWYRYIRHHTHNEPLKIRDWVRAESIRAISLMAYYLHPAKRVRMAKELTGINVLQTYRDVIRLFEGRLCHA